MSCIQSNRNIDGTNIFRFMDSDIEDVQIFGMTMSFISSSEAKNAYFMSGEATNEIYIFLLYEMK